MEYFYFWFMGKKMFVLIVVLMSISLIGIISVQLYWINNAIESKDTQFNSDVKVAMAAVSERIKLKEEDDFYRKYDPIIQARQLADKAQIRLLDMQGRPVQNRSLNPGKAFYKVDLQNLSSGMYYLELFTTEKSIRRQKIVVRH